MITDIKEIEKSALNLDRKNKARLADLLLQSIHGDIDPDVEEAWIQEVQKRKKMLQSGEASMHSASEVLDEARKRVQKWQLNFTMKPKKNSLKPLIITKSKLLALVMPLLKNVLNVIEQYPSSGTKITTSERRFLVPRFPYGLIYAVDDDLITIFAVMDLRQKPGYWESRT